MLAGTLDSIITRIVREGALVLAPPGLELALADVYGAAQALSGALLRAASEIRLGQRGPGSQPSVGTPCWTDFW